MSPGSRKIDTAVLLAAGRGTRLKPYTDHVPKPLLEIRGKPALDWLLASLNTAGISNVIIVGNYLEEQIQNFVDSQLDRWNGSILCAHQQQLDGTAPAVAAAVSARPDWFNNSFMVTATDYIVEPDFYSTLLRFHQSHQSDISISLKQLPADELSARSSVRFSGNFAISEVVEKPARGTAPSEYSANLIYVLPPSVVPLIRDVAPSARGERELQSAINTWLKTNGNARGILQPTPAEWQPGN